MKKCKRCLVSKSLDEFYGQTRNTDGLRPYCKICDKAQARITYHKNKDLMKLRKLRKNEGTRKIN